MDSNEKQKKHGPGLTNWKPSPQVNQALRSLQQWERDSSGSTRVIGGRNCLCHRQHHSTPQAKKVTTMDPKSLKRLSDLFGVDLTGWQITLCHFLELDHTFMGSFPAIDESGGIIFTQNKQMLQKVWNRLPRRSAKVTSLMAIIHPGTGVAFNLEHFLKGETEPFRVLSNDAINALCQRENSVSWAPGLLTLSSELVHDPVFT